MIKKLAFWGLGLAWMKRDIQHIKRDTQQMNEAAVRSFARLHMGNPGQ